MGANFTLLETRPRLSPAKSGSTLAGTGLDECLCPRARTWATRLPPGEAPDSARQSMKADALRERKQRRLHQIRLGTAWRLQMRAERKWLKSNIGLFARLLAIITFLRNAIPFSSSRCKGLDVGGSAEMCRGVWTRTTSRSSCADASRPSTACHTCPQKEWRPLSPPALSRES